jgi:hypothetical protein
VSKNIFKGKKGFQRLEPYRYLYNKLKREASKRQYSFSLTFNQFKRFTKITKCHYCGETVTWLPHKKHGARQGYNLDRKDNSKGYSMKNSAVCCYRCNLFKKDMNEKDFLFLCRQIYWSYRSCP